MTSGSQGSQGNGLATVSFDFTGKTVFVTGAAGGIGYGTARAFARAGAFVILSDIAESKGEEAARSIRSDGGGAEFVQLDVASADRVDEVVADAAARHGRIDIAFNNAGAGGAYGPLADTVPDDWRRVIEVDLLSIYYCMRAEIKVMQASGGGVIVNNSSIMGLMGGYSLSAYMSAKHGVVGMTRAAAMDYARFGIRINAVCPGTIATDMTVHHPAAFRERLDLATPLGRPGTIEEVGQAVLWLSSDGASYMVGQALAIDGGQALGGVGTRFFDA